MNNIIRRLIAAGTLSAFGLTGVLAASAPAVAQDVAGPGVASIAGIDGYATVVRADSGAQVAAVVNAPLLPGDYLSTDSGSSVQVALDGVSALRLAQDSQIQFVNLTPGSREISLAAGTTVLSQMQWYGGGPQIDTPSITVRPNQSGRYRVSVINGQTFVTIRAGSATVSSGAGSQVLGTGQTLVAYGDYSNPSISMEAPVGYDAFDRAVAAYDETLLANYNSTPYLAPQLAGYTNWNQYGFWSNVPGYGEVWTPNDQNGNWAPYQNGQYVWEPGYGYTWVGNEPWGYAPYHYGNWFWNSNANNWAWEPPAYNYQTSPTFDNTWAPALVSFFLNGATNGGLGYNGYGNIGWVPLAPGEAYQPWYNGGYQYPPTQITYVTNYYTRYVTYRNIRYYPLRLYPIDHFRNGDYSHPGVMRPDQVRSVAFLHGAIPVVPTRGALNFRPIVVRHQVVIAKAFEAGHLAERAKVVTRPTFTEAQSQYSRIVAAKPETAPLPKTVASHPVYKPEPHAAVQPIVEAPVKTAPIHTMAPRPVEVKPIATPMPVQAKPVEAKPVETKPVEAKPIATPVQRPVYHPVQPERPVQTERPVATPAPVKHEAPVYHPAAPPTARPVQYTPAQPMHPVQRPVTPQAKPAAATAKPAATPAKPTAKPAAKPDATKKPEEPPA